MTHQQECFFASVITEGCILPVVSMLYCFAGLLSNCGAGLSTHYANKCLFSATTATRLLDVNRWSRWAVGSGNSLVVKHILLLQKERVQKKQTKKMWIKGIRWNSNDEKQGWKHDGNVMTYLFVSCINVRKVTWDLWGEIRYCLKPEKQLLLVLIILQEEGKAHITQI